MPDLNALLAPGGDPVILSDTGLNDSDKTFYVPLSFVYEIDYIWVELATDSTVGNRELTIELQDANLDVIAQVQANSTQAASLSHEYLFGNGLPVNDGADATKHTVGLPRLVLPPRTTIRVYDVAAVAVGGDDMVVKIGVMRRWATSRAGDSAIDQQPGRAALTISGSGPVEMVINQQGPAYAALTVTAYAPAILWDRTASPAASPNLTITAQTPVINEHYNVSLVVAPNLSISGYQPAAAVST